MRIQRRSFIAALAAMAACGARCAETATPSKEELLKWFLDNVYGHAPIGRPKDMTFAGNSIVFGGGKMKVDLTVALPANASKEKPCPVLVMGDFRTWNNGMRDDASSKKQKQQQDDIDAFVVSRGYAIVHYNLNEATPDQPRRRELEALKKAGKPLPPYAYGLFEVYGGEKDRTGSSWGTIRSWAWCHSRVLDWIEAQPMLDAKRVAVLGHSRLGKTAICAGVTDPRFKVVYSNASGCGGAKLNHVDLPKSESIDVISGPRRFHYWFCRNFRKYAGREMSMDFDQHELVALMAPRAVAIASASEDAWAGQRGEFCSAALASPVWELYGQKGLETRGRGFPRAGDAYQDGCISYHVRAGKHNLTPEDWTRYMDFADRVMGKKK